MALRKLFKQRQNKRSWRKASELSLRQERQQRASLRRRAFAETASMLEEELENPGTGLNVPDPGSQ